MDVRRLVRRVKDKILPGPRSLETLEELKRETGGSVNLSQAEADLWRTENCPPHMWSYRINGAGEKCRICGETTDPKLYAIGYEDQDGEKLYVSRRRRLVASAAWSRARLGGRIWEPEMNEAWVTHDRATAMEQARELAEHYERPHHVLGVIRQREDGIRGEKVAVVEPKEDQPDA